MMPRGMVTSPITQRLSSGCHTPAKPLPSIIADRMPSRAYNAGETWASHCIHTGSTLIG